MLICKVFVNEQQIEEIKLQRIEPLGDMLTANPSVEATYKIHSPEELEGRLVRHNYYDGYIPLLRFVLKALEERREKLNDNR